MAQDPSLWLTNGRVATYSIAFPIAQLYNDIIIKYN